MLEKLKLRLTLLYTLSTGTIVTLVVITISLVSQWNRMERMQETFQNHILSISTRLQNDLIFNVSWLASMEASNGLIIHIEENGKPLKFKGSWQPQTNRQELIDLAKQQAILYHTDTSVRPISSVNVTPVFTVSGAKKDKYNAIVITYPEEKGYKSLTLLYFISPALNTLKNQRILFFVINLCGIAALYFAAKKLVKNAVRPVEISNQKQKDFIAAASHELRSPLMVIQSNAQAMESVPKKAPLFLENITKECHRMNLLIQDLLTLASLDAGRWSIREALLDPNLLLIEFYERFEPICQAKKVPFELRLPEEILPNIKGDQERLIQVLTILMDNALSYNIDSKPIILSAWLQKSSLKISVIDHGPGISSHQKNLVFENFYRGDSSRKDKQHFGLGLSIAKELMTLHKGSILLTDTPGGGCTFLLSLPFSK